jgi:hypothetical protein
MKTEDVGCSEAAYQSAQFRTRGTPRVGFDIAAYITVSADLYKIGRVHVGDLSPHGRTLLE